MDYRSFFILAVRSTFRNELKQFRGLLLSF